MNFKSKQAIFDYVGAFLIEQGVRSYDNVEMACRYRGNNGTMCAVGCLIPDEIYRTKFEMLTVDGLVRNCFKLPWYINRYAKFLRSFQLFHDDRNSWNENGLKVDRLIAFGKLHNLDTSKFQ